MRAAINVKLTRTVGYMPLLFVPSWLGDIHPINPAGGFDYSGIAAYPLSRLAARTVNSSQGATASGVIEDPIAMEKERAAAHRAKKAAKRVEHYRRAAELEYDRMDCRSERRARKEAKRIMNRRRADAMAAFMDEKEAETEVEQHEWDNEY